MLQNSSDERALVSGLKPILKPGILKTLPTKYFTEACDLISCQISEKILKRI